MKTQVFKNFEEFCQRENKQINGVSQEFAENNPNFEEDNQTNVGCWNCRSCSYCSDCSDCRSCSYCSDCSDCRSCSDCSDFKTNPERIVSPFLGSRNSQSTYYWNGEIELVVCGCFKGTLHEFQTKVIKTHGDNEHGKGYIKWINAITEYRKLIG